MQVRTGAMTARTWWRNARMKNGAREGWRRNGERHRADEQREKEKRMTKRKRKSCSVS